MTLGPVASLSAQVSTQVNGVEWISSEASLGNAAEVNAGEDTLQVAQADTQHSCCEESKCNCSYQNECDIQNLTFFTLSKSQPQIQSSIEPNSVITTYLPVFHKSESSSIYRPPIT